VSEIEIHKIVWNVLIEFDKGIFVQ